MRSNTRAKSPGDSHMNSKSAQSKKSSVEKDPRFRRFVADKPPLTRTSTESDYLHKKSNLIGQKSKQNLNSDGC
jgi:hypothetical protein